jgi:hypothetical protein
VKSKDEGGRRKDESKVLSVNSFLSSFIPHPSALLFTGMEFDGYLWNDRKLSRFRTEMSK